MTLVEQGIARWHANVTSRDAAGIPALLAEDAVFYSPIVHTPQIGRDAVTAYLTAALHVLNTGAFRYTGEWHAADSAVLAFETKLDAILIDGVDMITWRQDGLITAFKVMVRPLKAIQMVHAQMGAMLQSQSAR